MPNSAQQNKSKQFGFFWGSQTVSLIAMQFGGITIPLLAIETLGASSTQVASISFAATLPWLLFGLFAGLIVDRWHGKHLTVFSHLARSFVLVILMLLLVSNDISVRTILIATFVMGCLSMLFEVSRRSLLPSILAEKDLASGKGKLAISDSIARVAGPSIAGRMMTLVSIPTALFIQAGLLGIAAQLVSALRLVKVARPETGSPIQRESPLSGIR